MAKTAPFTGFFCRFCHFFLFLSLFSARAALVPSLPRKKAPENGCLYPKASRRVADCALSNARMREFTLSHMTESRVRKKERKMRPCPRFGRDSRYLPIPLKGPPRQGVGLRPRTNDARFVFFLFFLPLRRAQLSYLLCHAKRHPKTGAFTSKRAEGLQIVRFQMRE